MVLQNNTHVKIRSLLLSIFCYVFLAPLAHASVLFFHPQDRIEVEEGESVVVEARLDTEGKTVNAIDATLLFSPDKLEVLDVSLGESVVQLWISEPEIDNAAGRVHFVGGIPSGGFFSAGLIARITFRARAQGESALGWDGASQVLLNDGVGTADSVTKLPTPLVVTEAMSDVPRVSSRTHPEQSAWHKEKTLVLNWQLQDGAVYSYALDHDPRGIPDEIPDTPEGELKFLWQLKYEGLDDGMYYFHLRQGIAMGATTRWSRTRTYRAQIDSTPPESLSAQIGSDPYIFEGRFFVSFSGSDAPSGMAQYDVWEPSTDWVLHAKPPYELRDTKNRAPIRVRAQDKARNSKEISVEIPPRPPTALKTSLKLLLVM